MNYKNRILCSAESKEKHINYFIGFKDKALSVIFFKNRSFKNFLIAILDQVFISISSFAVGLYISRNFDKSEYGYYVLMITLTQILVTYQNALINTPLLVNDHGQNDGYVEGVDSLNNYLSFCASCMVSALGFYFYGFEYIFVGILCFVVLSKELKKNILYVNLDLCSILKVDFIYFVFMLLCLFFLRIDSLLQIILMLIFTHCLSLFVVIKKVNMGKVRKKLLEIIRINWKVSKWAVVGVTATILQNRSYVYITTLMIDAEVLAEIFVARMIMMPLALCVGSSGKIIVVMGRRMKSEGKLNDFEKNLMYALFTMTFIFFMYTIFSVIMYDYINIYIFLGKYDNIHYLIILWGIYFMIQMYRYVLSNVMQVYFLFKEMACAGIISGLIVPALCIVLTNYYASYGALLSVVVGEIVLLITFSVKFFSEERK